jgi:hypothetical protein
MAKAAAIASVAANNGTTTERRLLAARSTAGVASTRCQSIPLARRIGAKTFSSFSMSGSTSPVRSQR